MFIKYFAIKSFIHFGLKCISLSELDIINIYIMKEPFDWKLFLWCMCSPSCLTFWWQGFTAIEDFQFCSWWHRAGHIRSHYFGNHKSGREFIPVLFFQSFQNSLTVKWCFLYVKKTLDRQIWMWCICSCLIEKKFWKFMFIELLICLFFNEKLFFEYSLICAVWKWQLFLWETFSFQEKITLKVEASERAIKLGIKI